VVAYEVGGRRIEIGPSVAVVVELCLVVSLRCHSAKAPN
jgi:hypothetical protein